MPVTRQMLRFGAVGAIGFVIDGGLLWVLVANGANPFYVRALSFPTAVAATWWLNRIWTFRHADARHPRRQFIRYVALQVVGTLANLGAYLTILAVIAPTALNALGALGVGALVGMVTNFTMSRRYVFTPPAPWASNSEGRSDVRN